MVDLTRLIALGLAVEFVALGTLTMPRGGTAPKWLSVVAGVLLAAAVAVTL